jgi:uncharacterized protein YbaP (TraB family)
MPYGHGRFFKLSRAGLPPSYIFGTLHLADPRIAQLSLDVAEALSKSSTLVVELKDNEHAEKLPAKEAKAAAKRVLLARPDQRPEDLLSKKDMSKLNAEVFVRHLPNLPVEKLKPAFLALLLDTPACAQGSPLRPVLDTLLIGEARRQGLKIVGLETVAEQVQTFDVLPYSADRQLLLSTIFQSHYAEDMIETIIQRYINKDLGSLVAWMRSPQIIPGEAGFVTPPVFLDLLLDARNETMLRKILPLLDTGAAFIAVGAAHLPGPDGLVSRIKERGYEVDLLD